MQDNLENCACPAQPATIMVVEDSEAIRRVVCFMLRESGYNCVEASNGIEALQILRAVSPIELVLTDIVMPEMDGTELVRHLSCEFPDIRVMLMSGYSDDAMVCSLQRTAVFLSKPFTAAALTTGVRRVLDDPWEGIPAEQSDSGC
jgi:two-component system, cell cycle sensor histidine kinase and response regulator CckA